MRNKLCVVVLTLLLVGAVYGQPSNVPATPKPKQVEQPNGEKLTLYLKGDERSHFLTTEDGYRVEKNKRGYYCYVKQAKDGKRKLTCRKAQDVADRSKSHKEFLRKLKQ